MTEHEPEPRTRLARLGDVHAHLTAAGLQLAAAVRDAKAGVVDVPEADAEAWTELAVLLHQAKRAVHTVAEHVRALIVADPPTPQESAADVDAGETRG